MAERRSGRIRTTLRAVPLTADFLDQLKKGDTGAGAESCSAPVRSIDDVDERRSLTPEQVEKAKQPGGYTYIVDSSVYDPPQPAAVPSVHGGEILSEPVLLWSVTTTVFVDYHMFYLFDFESGSAPDEFSIPDGEWWSISGPGGVVFASALSSHKPTVTIQLFEDEPDPDAQDWERVEVGAFSTTEPEISLACPTASPSDTTLTLHRSGNFRYRLHYRNPEGLTEVDMVDESVDGSSEEYLIQLW